jgi:hypothetical protein
MTLSEIETFLEGFQASIPEIKQVIFGDEQEIMNRQNSQIRYPVMWVETPDVAIMPDPPGLRFKFSISFLQNVSKDSNKLDRQARSDMLILAQRAYALLEHGQEDGLYEFTSIIEDGQPILRWSGDRDTGWRIPVQLTVGRDDC